MGNNEETKKDMVPTTENEEKIETEKRQRDIELYCRKSLITPKVLKGKFENVVLNSKIEEKYYKRLLNYCKVFDEVKEDGVGILLTGNPGTGKSFYTSCIYNQLKDKYKVYRFNFSFYLETLKKDFNEFFDSFILDAIEGNNCYCGGGGVEDKLEFVVECGTCKENLNSKLKLITEWLDGRPDVIDYTTGDFFALRH